MEDLEKVLSSWKHVIGHDKGKLSEGMRELILQTIRLLEELKKKRGANPS